MNRAKVTFLLSSAFVFIALVKFLMLWSLVIKETLLTSVASKRVHVRKKDVLIGWKHDMFCHHTFEVWIRRLLSTCFHPTKYSLQEFLEFKNNCKRQVCCFSARNMPEKWEKWKMDGTRWSTRYIKQLNFGPTVCFNDCQTSNVWGQNTSCLAPY